MALRNADAPYDDTMACALEPDGEAFLSLGLPEKNGASCSCSLNQMRVSNTDCSNGIVGKVVPEVVSPADSAWDVDLLHHHFRDITEPTTDKKSSARRVTASMRNISDLQLFSLDDNNKDRDRATATHDIDGERMRAIEADSSLSWPFDTNSRIIVQNGTKLSVQSEYGNNNKLDSSDRALFPTTFGTSTTFAILTPVLIGESAKVPALAVEAQTPVAAATSATALAASSASDFLTLSTKTPKTPCQKQRAPKTSALSETGTTWSRSSDFPLETSTQVESSETRMICREGRKDEGVIRRTTSEDSEQSNAKVWAGSETHISTRHLHGQDPIDTGEQYPLLDQPIPKKSTGGSSECQPNSDEDRNLTTGSVGILVGDSLLQNLLGNKEAKSTRDFECVQNRQLLHKLIYKHKMGISLKVPQVAHADTADI